MTHLIEGEVTQLGEDLCVAWEYLASARKTAREVPGETHGIPPNSGTISDIRSHARPSEEMVQGSL
jgi:hypothetical protein